jgi:predicted nucleotidyltransferase
LLCVLLLWQRAMSPDAGGFKLLRRHGAELRPTYRRMDTFGLGPIREAFEPYARAIRSAFVYGSVAKGTDTAHSDIDLLVIGDDLDYADLYAAAQDVERKLRRK